MRHLSEEELIEHYYGEGGTQKSAVALHLELCGKCARSYQTLRKDLEEIKPTSVPELSPDFGEKVWQSIRNSLPVYEKKEPAWMRIWRWHRLGYALTCALLVVAAFTIGRLWEHRQSQNTVATNNSQGKERVVLLVVGDHLDRSERLLVELNHANNNDPQLTLPIQTEARELLAANRLYRQSADRSSDPLLAAALDHLERVLIEVANEPDGLSRQDIARLQKEMNTDGLLFEIRVLRTKASQQTGNEETAKKGTSI